MFSGQALLIRRFAFCVHGVLLKKLVLTHEALDSVTEELYDILREDWRRMAQIGSEEIYTTEEKRSQEPGRHRKIAITSRSSDTMKLHGLSQNQG